MFGDSMEFGDMNFNGRKERGPESIFYSIYVCVNCTAT